MTTPATLSALGVEGRREREAAIRRIVEAGREIYDLGKPTDVLSRVADELEAVDR